ncbi:hypothetical protein LTR91_013043 [Friedmanniomyces endolithicus]|uniref:Uncharacterized protein n=1 Tax=Friedmanniomyces endolithicus TaxID=329885 RepID=A0AAN6QPP0_9PEZI|nr:hypothetical protein LTR59_013846 [Friedmanniomyces endolithicus]KAK0978238.1 hypothetical protein LTR91_013043 [Friedmanniomyces endolithicus]KAK1031141.1 hypothetical protein LTS16_018277 [Friedmanniomyces endolithicus]
MAADNPSEKPGGEDVRVLEQQHKGSVTEGELETVLGYKTELARNRSLWTLLFQSLAIAAIPYGMGSRSFIVQENWVIILVLDESIALSLGELASRYPTSGGPSYWSFQVAPKYKVALAYITGWVWLIGNWTITLSGAYCSMYHPDFLMSDWQLLLVFYALCLFTFVICTFFNKYLPMVDTICAGFTALSIVIILIALSVSAASGRHSAAYTLGHYDTSFAGYGSFTFFIGLLPSAYTFSAIGMISAMAEECADPAVKVMGSPGGGLGLIFLVLVITLFCSISITVAASRCTWAFARDDAIPGAKIWAKVDERLGVPVNSLALVTVVQMLLGLINLGSSSAFTAFVSVGVQALALAYGIPIGISLFCGRKEVNKARWNLGQTLGTIVNVLALVWIAFELVLFSMPTALPIEGHLSHHELRLGSTSAPLPIPSQSSTDPEHQVLVGFGAIAALWYAIYSRKSYNGPPASEGL